MKRQYRLRRLPVHPDDTASFKVLDGASRGWTRATPVFAGLRALALGAVRRLAAAERAPRARRLLASRIRLLAHVPGRKADMRSLPGRVRARATAC